MLGSLNFFKLLQRMHAQQESILSILQQLQATLANINTNVAALAQQTPPGGLNSADVATLTAAINALDSAVASLITPTP